MINVTDIKITTVFYWNNLQRLKTVKRIRNYVLKYNLYLFIIKIDDFL